MKRYATMHVIIFLCFTYLVASGWGQTDASQIAPYDSAFGGFSFGIFSDIGTNLPFIGLTGIYDTQLRNSHHTVGVMGTANFAFAKASFTNREIGSSHALFLSPMVCWGHPYDNSIFHVGIGVAMFDGEASLFGEELLSGRSVLPTATALYTYYLQTANAEQFAINLGVQWFPGQKFMFTISPGFLTLGRRR